MAKRGDDILVNYEKQGIRRPGVGWMNFNLSSEKAWLSHFFEENSKKLKKVLDKPLKISYCRAVKKNKITVKPFKVLKGVSR